MTMNSQKRLDYIKKNITAKNIIDNAGYPTFYKETPVRTGNARRNTLKTNTSIYADYPYAQRLDNGYSKQSPKGMVKPTLAAIQAYIKKILGV